MGKLSFGPREETGDIVLFFGTYCYSFVYMISVIFPAYNEEGNVALLHRGIHDALKKLGQGFEIIAIDDGSTDATLAELKKLSPLTIISFAKNKGQSAALDAGIKQSRGEIIVTIDADMQNDPDDIGLLVSKLNEGYDVVSGWRADRHDTFIRKAISRVANGLTACLMGLYLHDSAGPLKAIRRSVLQGVNLYGEMHSFLPAVLFARGAKVSEIQVTHQKRFSGKSKYHPLKLMKSTGDLLVIKFMSDYMARPFLFFGGWGFLSLVLGFVAGISSLVLKLTHVRNITETPLPILATLLIVVGVILVMMGFLAEMLLRVYFETKGGTPYVIKTVIENKI